MLSLECGLQPSAAQNQKPCVFPQSLNWKTAVDLSGTPKFTLKIPRARQVFPRVLFQGPCAARARSQVPKGPSPGRLVAKAREVNMANPRAPARQSGGPCSGDDDLWRFVSPGVPGEMETTHLSSCGVTSTAGWKAVGCAWVQNTLNQN